MYVYGIFVTDSSLMATYCTLFANTGVTNIFSINPFNSVFDMEYPIVTFRSINASENETQTSPLKQMGFFFLNMEKYLQIVQILMRRLIWIYTVCKHGSLQRAVGLKGLILLIMLISIDLQHNTAYVNVSYLNVPSKVPQ